MTGSDSAVALGVLLFSVDLELDVVGRAAGRSAALDDVTTRLVKLFAHYDLCATWAVADPAVSAATDVILAAGRQHELALLGDATWVGPGAGRERFARELSRRVSAAKNAGIRATTLSLRDTHLDTQRNLVVEQGITAVRPAIKRHRDDTEIPAVQSLRPGLWSLPACGTLPGDSRWIPGGGGVRAARKTITQACDQRLTAHINIDANRLLAVGRSGYRSVEQVLRHAALFHDRQLLRVETLAYRVKGLSRPQGKPAELRPAA